MHPDVSSGVSAQASVDGNPAGTQQPNGDPQLAAPANTAEARSAVAGTNVAEDSRQQADADAAVAAVRQQAQAARQQLCEQMVAALRQLQAEAQDLAQQTQEMVHRQNVQPHQPRTAVKA